MYMEKELSIQELSNQMIDNCVAWKNLKRKLCKVIKNCLLPSSVSAIDETLDVTVIDMRPVQDGPGLELVFRVVLLDQAHKISFLLLEELNQMFCNGITDIELQPFEAVYVGYPNYKLSFTLKMRSVAEPIEAPAEVKEQAEVQEG